jgi:sarcosine oxidase subunit gamma
MARSTSPTKVASKKAAPAKAAAAPRRAASPARTSDPGVARANVLAHDAVPGRYGAVRDGGPGVTLSVVHPLSILTVIARKGRAGELAAAMNGWLGVEPPGAGGTAAGKTASVAWAGPDQWFVIARDQPEGALYDAAAERLAGLASVSDQSHGRIMVRIAGPKARQVLAKGSSADFHPRAFAAGQCAMTQMAHIGVHVTQAHDGVFDLVMFRGFSEGFWEWLTEMAEEYGYEVR